MKAFFHILFVLLLGSPLLSAQDTDWAKFDKIKELKSSDASKLSLMITGEFPNQEDKVKAIYYWVAHNIEYDLRLYRKYKKEQRNRSRKKYTEAQIQKITNHEISKTLRKKKGVCKQYSLLFAELCKHSKINCEFVSGHARNNPRKSKSKGESHAWNVVKINNQWKMVDATWGSGFVDHEGKFQFKFDPNYFSTKRELFVKSHLPKDEYWQLLDSIVETDQFKQFPITGPSFIEYNIQNLVPEKNVIEVEEGQEIIITFESDHQLSSIVSTRLRRDKEKEYEEIVGSKFELVDKTTQISIETNDFKSGNYCFYGDGRRMFCYRVSVR